VNEAKTGYMRQMRAFWVQRGLHEYAGTLAIVPGTPMIVGTLMT
jgi:hypothetical protein